MAKKQTAKELQVLHNKKKLLEALEKSLGIVTRACKAAGITRTTFYRYVKDDKEFAAAVEELADVALDFAEEQLHAQILDGIPASTIFYLKTKGKKRGYGDHMAIDHNLNKMPEGTSFGIKIHKKSKK